MNLSNCLITRTSAVMFSKLQRDITNGNIRYLKQLFQEEFYGSPLDMLSGFNLCHPEQLSIFVAVVLI